MNSFATIEVFKRYKRVTYYTLRIDEHKWTETDKFFEQMKRKEAYHADMRNFVEWLRIIGDDKGAHEDYFRDEGIVWALPPEAKIMKGRFVKNIRLYCHLVSSSVVILYNGGIKSEATVQQCPNVSMHWQNAKIATRKLKDQIEHEGKRITNIEDIIIQL